MNNIEETLWNYIDGNCSANEQIAITLLIEKDAAYKFKYKELLLLNKEFEGIELEEPPMAFIYNVIEAIRTEQSLVPLKAAINKRIISGIAVFLLFTLFSLLIFTITQINWSLIGNVPVNIPAGLKIPEVKNYFSKPVLQGFLFFDTVLALYLFDTYMRKKKFNNPGNISIR